MDVDIKPDAEECYGADERRPWFVRIEAAVTAWFVVAVLTGLIVGLAVGISNGKGNDTSKNPVPIPSSPRMSPPSKSLPVPETLSLLPASPSLPPSPSQSPIPSPPPPSIPSPPVPEVIQPEDEQESIWWGLIKNPTDTSTWNIMGASCDVGDHIVKFEMYLEAPVSTSGTSVETPISGLTIHCSNAKSYPILVPPAFHTGNRVLFEDVDGFSTVDGAYGKYIDWMFIQSNASAPYLFYFTCPASLESDNMLIDSVFTQYSVENYQSKGVANLMRQIRFKCSQGKLKSGGAG